jgi:quercetin dioxygenase-like cupin family protein
MPDSTIVRDPDSPRAGNHATQFARVDRSLRWAAADGVGVASWVGEYDHAGGATAYVLVAEPASLTGGCGTYPLPARSYAVLPDTARIEGGSGVVITTAGHRGFFLVGGPVEPTGRLRYIDGCTDSVLVAPIRRGDPCLNLLHLPPDTVQTNHRHPSVRVGLVLEGRGRCVLMRGTDHTDHAERTEALTPGTAFVLAPDTVHRFETDAHEGLLLMAWHPDSDTGPTDDDHPMLNRTFVGDTGAADESRLHP